MSGFGMTEATGGITMTYPGEYQDGSLGTALPGIELELADDGELLVRGPYLMTGYDQKTMTLSHDSDQAVKFTVEVDFVRNGKWCVYDVLEVPASGIVTHKFPDGYSAHWVRVTADKTCKATAQLVYE